MSTLLDSTLCCLALCLSYAALCFGWAQWKESQSWSDDEDDEDWWKKERNES